MTAIFAWTHQGLGGPFLTLIVSPADPALTLPVSNGDVVATLQGVWSNGATFTGSYIFVAPNFDHSGDYAISGSNLVVNNATNLNALGSVTIEDVDIEASQ